VSLAKSNHNAALLREADSERRSPACQHPGPGSEPD